MKKNWMRSTLRAISIMMPLITQAIVTNTSKFQHEIVVVEDRASLNSVPQKSVSRHTPPAPYDAVTFTITAPVKVCLGQIFAIDYAIQISKFTHISFWSDLIPDSSQGLPVKLIEVIHPTIGTFERDDASIAHKGGNGLWTFPKGLPAGSVQHLRLLVQATDVGLITFSTFVATNPPFYIGNAGTLVSCSPPVASPIHVFGFSRQPLEISILDYVIADSELTITTVSSASYGAVQLNDDYTITYTPYMNFYGNDSFTYSVTDAAGNVIHGMVTITIEPTAVPQIIS